MPTLFDELTEVSQYIELLNEEQINKMNFALFNRRVGVWKKLPDLGKIDFYEKFPIPEKYHAKIYIAWLLRTNEIVTESKNNKEVPSDVIEWFQRN